MLRVTIREREKPVEPNPMHDIDWICKSLGFVSPRDFDETAGKIFKALVQAMKEQKGLSSDEISERSGVTRGAVVHHLKSYVDSGVIIHEKRTYMLRTRSIEKTIEQMENDMLRVLEDIKRIAKEVDNELGLKER